MIAQSIEQRLPYSISVCGRGEVEYFRDDNITHLLSIDSPGSPTPTPEWFNGVHRHFAFADVENKATAYAFGVVAPGKEDVKEILGFGRECLEDSLKGRVHLVIHCLAGVSRSPAAAYAIMCMLLGPGYEEETFEYLLKIRSCAYPNTLMVKYADQILDRRKAMIKAQKDR
ncbi:MAG: hypothetical protein R6V06_03120 [Kiritimatiellia bacterium]